MVVLSITRDWPKNAQNRPKIDDLYFSMEKYVNTERLNRLRFICLLIDFSLLTIATLTINYCSFEKFSGSWSFQGMLKCLSSWTKGRNQLNFLDIAPHSEPEAVA
jgi:hypothetical protein